MWMWVRWMWISQTLHWNGYIDIFIAHIKFKGYNSSLQLLLHACFFFQIVRQEKAYTKKKNAISSPQTIRVDGIRIASVKV